LMGGFTRHPDVALATKVGDPQLADTQTVSASEVIRDETRAMSGGAAGGDHKVAVETVNSGTPPPSEPTPRSDSPAPATTTAPPANSGGSSPAPADSATTTTEPGAGAAQVDPSAPPPQNTGIGELKPNVTDNSTGDAAATPPPAQVNEIQNGAAGQATDTTGTTSSSSSASSGSSSNSNDADPNYSSSRKKKKRKILPF
jgi:hypothetical protein